MEFRLHLKTLIKVLSFRLYTEIFKSVQMWFDAHNNHSAAIAMNSGCFSCFYAHSTEP